MAAVPDAIKYTSEVFGGIVLLGTFFIFVSVFLFRRLRSFTFRMITFMAMIDFVLAATIVFGPLGDEAEENKDLPMTFQCKVQSACLQFFTNASLLWTVCFGVHLFRITSFGATAMTTHTWKAFLSYFVVSVGLPIYSVVYIFSRELQGVSGDLWCWLSDKGVDHFAWKILYVEVLVLVLILLLFFVWMRLRLKKLYEVEQVENEILLQNKKLFITIVSKCFSLYLITPAIAFVPAHFNLIMDILGIENNSHVVSWYFLSATLLGVLRVGTFFLAIPIVRQHWRLCCKRGRHRASRRSTQFYMELV